MDRADGKGGGKMAVGTRQIVLMTHLALSWPKRLGMDSVRSLVDPDCKHPTMKVNRIRHGKRNTEDQTACYCWTQIDSIKKIYDGLVNRGLIEKEDDTYQLTGRGWNVLHLSRKAPVTITSYEDSGMPIAYKIKKSQLKEFQVLYL